MVQQTFLCLANITNVVFKEKSQPWYINISLNMWQRRP